MDEFEHIKTTVREQVIKEASVKILRFIRDNDISGIEAICAIATSAGILLSSTNNDGDKRVNQKISLETIMSIFSAFVEAGFNSNEQVIEIKKRMEQSVLVHPMPKGKQ